MTFVTVCAHKPILFFDGCRVTHRISAETGRVRTESSGEPVLSERYRRPSFYHFACDLLLLCTGEDARGKREENGILKFNVRAIHRREMSKKYGDVNLGTILRGWLQTSQNPVPPCRARHSQVHMFLWQHRCTISCAMDAPSKPFVVTRKKCIVPKPRRIERLPSGYAVQEFRDDSQGC